MDFVKKNDKLVSLLVLFVTVVLIFVLTRDFFLTFAADYPLLGGFVKFFFLASIGDFIGARFTEKRWSMPKNILLKAVVWGLIGMVIVMMFTIFSSGVETLQNKRILPFEGSVFFTAFFISTFMNVIFAPTMMSFHRVSDTYLNGVRGLDNAIKSIDWVSFVRVVLFKTIPFFWIPAHTITFLLPSEYRIIFAAVLGIFLGLILRVVKK